jgi:putative adhesin
MRRALHVAFALSLGLAVNGCIGGNLGLPFRATVDETRPLSANGELELENTNGSVRLVAWDEAKVRVEATKRAASERALEELKVEIEGEGDRVTVRTRYPRPHWLGNAGSVEYRVSVPRSARVRVTNVNGRVEVGGVAGSVHAATVNGSVDLTEVGGPIEASAVNGSVEVDVARVDPSARSRISSTNGSVRLTLPRDANADVEAHTVNGSVSCDFDLTGEHTSRRRRLEGRIGSGGARFELGTVNGSANVDRGLSAAASATSHPPAEASPGRATR